MNTKDLDYYTNLASERLSIAVESYKPGPWIEAPPPQSATINALDAAVARYEQKNGWDSEPPVTQLLSNFAAKVGDYVGQSPSLWSDVALGTASASLNENAVSDRLVPWLERSTFLKKAAPFVAKYADQLEFLSDKAPLFDILAAGVSPAVAGKYDEIVPAMLGNVDQDFFGLPSSVAGYLGSGDVEYLRQPFKNADALVNRAAGFVNKITGGYVHPPTNLVGMELVTYAPETIADTLYGVGEPLFATPASGLKDDRSIATIAEEKKLKKLQREYEKREAAKPSNSKPLILDFTNSGSSLYW